MVRLEWFLCAMCVMATATSLKVGESYFHNGSFVSLTVSDKTIVVQRDTTAGLPDVAGFFEAHPCLDPDSGQKYVDRAFYQYWLRGGCEFALDYTIKASPLGYGNALHFAPGGGDQNLVRELLTD